MDDKELPEWFQMLKEIFVELNAYDTNFYQNMNCPNVLNQVRFAAIRDEKRFDVEQQLEIAAEKQNEHVRRMIVRFGEGKIMVMRTTEADEDFDSGLAFAIQEAHPIGEVIPNCIGKTTDEVGSFLRFHFSKSASVQVLIDDLVIVRDSLREIESRI